MEAAVCLQSKQNATRRPLRNLFSINQRRKTLRKHHLIGLPIFAHSHRGIGCSHVNATPSLPQPPSPPEALECRSADVHAAGSGVRWPRAAMAGLVLVCALAGSACMKPACARGGTPQKNMNKPPINSTVAIATPEASIESPRLERTRTLLSGILLAQKRPTTNFEDSNLLALLREYYLLTRDAERTLDLLFRIFSKEKERGGGDDPRILLVNIYIAMKEYEKARKVCETLFEDEKDGPRFPDARPSLQRAVIYMMLAVEKMLEPKAKEQDGTLMIEKAKKSWESYFREDLEIAKVLPDVEPPSYLDVGKLVDSSRSFSTAPCIK